MPRWSSALAIAAVLAGWLALAQSGFDSSEGPHAWELASRIAASGQIATDEQPRGPAAVGIDGRFYMSHDIGQAIALLPAALLVEHGLSGALLDAGLQREQIASAMSGLAAMFFVIAACLGVYVSAALLNLGDDRIPVLTALIAGTTTMLVPYSRMAFDGVLTGALLVWTLAAILMARRTASVKWIGVAAAIAGTALVTRQTAAATFAGFLLLAVWNSPFSVVRLATMASLALAPFVAWQLFYNWLRTGNPFMPAMMLQQYDVTNAVNGAGIVEGIAGFLISPGKSFLIYSPTMLLALYGYRSLWRDHREVCVAVMTMCVPFALAHAAVRNWPGDWGWGPRYLVTLVPLLMVGVAPALKRTWNRPRRRLSFVCGSVCVIGLVFQTLAIGSNWHFRYAHLLQSGSLDLQRIAWSPASAQWVDAFGAVLANLQRPWSHTAAPIVDGVHPFVEIGATTFNTWWVTLWVAGAPKALVMSGVLACVGLIAWGAQRLARTADPNSVPV